MENESREKDLYWEKLAIIASLAFGIVLIILILWNLFGVDYSKSVRQQNHAELIKKQEIATLSTSVFVYNGIAQALKDNGEIDYNVLYKSTVKVSFDVDKFSPSFDETKKTVIFSFPEIKIENPIVDENSISIIPTNRNDLLMKDLIALCKDDALAEVKKSTKLISSAQENLRTIIEAWYSPILEGYSFEYRFNAAEGGEAI